MHYTSVPNILKVLNPLFLDDLNAALEEAGDNRRKLANLRARIAKIRVFDPACGSGNFLVIAYKELRAIEAVINERRGEADRKTDKAAWDRLRKASIEELRGEGTLPVFIRSCRSARLIEVTVCVMRGKCYRL